MRSRLSWTLTSMQPGLLRQPNADLLIKWIFYPLLLAAQPGNLLWTIKPCLVTALLLSKLRTGTVSVIIFLLLYFYSAEISSFCYVLESVFILIEEWRIYSVISSSNSVIRIGIKWGWARLRWVWSDTHQWTSSKHPLHQQNGHFWFNKRKLFFLQNKHNSDTLY